MADGQIIIDINADPAEYRLALEKLQRETRSASGSLSSAFDKAGASLQSIGDAITLGITTPLTVGAGVAGKFSFEALRAAEQVDIAFGTMLGPKEGQEMLESLYDFAASTPFEVRGLSTATQKMIAYGFSAEEVIPLLTSVGDATAGLGAGQDGIDSVTRAMGQMQAKGKVMSEEMLQLTEVGIPAWRYLADAITGGDIPAAMEEVTYGFVSADVAIKALQDGMDRDFGGMMSKQAKTLTGIISNMSDAAYKAVIQAKDTEGYDEMTDALSDVSEQIGPLVESLLPMLDDLLSGAAGVLKGAADTMEDFSQMSEEGRRTVVGMVAAVAGLGPTASVAGRAIQGASSIAGFFSNNLDSIKRTAGKAQQGASALGKTVDDAALVFQIARASGDSLSSSLSAAGSQMGRTASSTGILAAGLRGLQGGLAGLAIAGVVASLAALTAEIIKAAEMERQMEDATLRLSDVTAEASSAMGRATGEIEASWNDKMRAIKADVDDLVTSQASLARQSEETWSSTLADSAMVQQYADVINRLADQSNLTAEEQVELETAVSGFNDICGTSISVIDPLNGKLSEQRDVVNQIGDAYMAQAKKAAAMEIIRGYYEEQIEVQMKMKEAEEQVDAARQKAIENMQVGNNLYDVYSQKQGEAQAELDRLTQQYDACSDNIEHMTEIMVDNGDAAGASADELSAYMKSTRRLGDAMDQAGADSAGLTSALSQLGVSTGDLADLTDEQLLQIANSYDGTISSVSNALQQFGYDAGRHGTQATANFANGLSSASWMALQAAAEVAGVSADELAKLAGEAGVSGDEAVQAYASAIQAGRSPADAASQVVKDAAADKLSSLQNSTYGYGSSAAGNYSSGIRSGSGSAGGSAESVRSSAAAPLSSLLHSTYGWGEEAAINFARGVAVQRARDIAWNAATTLANSIASIIGHSVPKAGPLRAGGKGEALWGYHAGMNFAEGLESSAPLISRAAASALGGMSDLMQSSSFDGWQGSSFDASWRATLLADADVGALASTMAAVGEKVDAMADRLEDAISRPNELTVNRREFGRLVKGVS